MSDTAYARIKNILKEFPFFEDFTDEEIAFFSKHASLRYFEVGSRIFQDGQTWDFMFFVVEGKVEVRLESAGQRRVVAYYSWGDCLGEMSILDDFPRNSNVVATEPCELLILTRNRFELMSAENPMVGLKLLKGVARNLGVRLRKMTGRFFDLS